MRDSFNCDHIAGRARCYYDGQQPPAWQNNSILGDWGGLMLPLLGGEDPYKYRVAALYIEFENNAGAAVTPPTFDRDDDAVDYYESLAASPKRDYLRVPIIARAYSKSDPSRRYDDVMLITARTTGTVGQHGKPFSAAQQSRVYGGAAIAMPDESDATQDRILSRLYWSDTSQQLIKLIGSEIGYDWEFTAR